MLEESNRPLGSFARFEYWPPFPLVPLHGIGTDNVESLAHYCSRLAWISGISLSTFIAALQASPHGGEKGCCNTASSFCGPGKNYVSLIDRIETGTGNYTLRHGSFWAMQQVLGNTGFNRESRHRRWCPLCVRDWNPDYSYDPLSWTVSLFTTCAIHGCELIDRCPHCSASQFHVSPQDCKSKCRLCARSLSTEPTYVTHTKFMQWIQLQIADLVKMCATPMTQQIPASNFIVFVGNVYKHALSSRRINRRMAKLVGRVFSRSLEHKPSLRMLLNVCALQGVSITDALTNPREASSAPLLNAWKNYDYFPLPRGMDPQRLRLAAYCLGAILSELHDVYVPPIASAVLLNVMVPGPVVKEAFPDLYTDYLRRLHSQSHYSKARLYAKCFEAALKELRFTGFESTDPRALGAWIACDGVDPSMAERIARSAVRVCQILSEARQLPLEQLPPLNDSLGWQMTCGNHVI
jgi:transposase-like protein